GRGRYKLPQREQIRRLATAVVSCGGNGQLLEPSAEAGPDLRQWHFQVIPDNRTGGVAGEGEEVEGVRIPEAVKLLALSRGLDQFLDQLRHGIVECHHVAGILRVPRPEQEERISDAETSPWVACELVADQGVQRPGIAVRRLVTDGGVGGALQPVALER